MEDTHTAQPESSPEGVGADIDSTLTQQQHTLERDNDVMRRGLAIVSHEMNTPLTSIVAFCDLLLRNQKGLLDGKEVDQLGSIGRNAGRLKELIGDLGQATVFGTQNGISIVRSSFDAADLIEESAISMRPVMELADQTLVVHPPPLRSVINADKSRLHQVLENLLTNASKFSPPPPVLT